MLMSILYLFLALLPVVAYIMIIWATTPWGSIELRKSAQYFLTGIISIGLLLTFFRLFPNWQSPVSPTNLSLSFMVLAFIQVALMEELCKFAAFKINEGIRGEDDIKYDSPIGTMFYCGISALGFSFIENVEYAIMYGGHVLVVRSFISMMVHFLCGLIMGYWISASRIPSRLENRSLMEVVFIKKPVLKRVVYSAIGITCAVILHGLFDYNIFTDGHVVSNYLIILGGIIATYLASKDLNDRVRKIH